MSWRQEYERKRVSAGEALDLIRSGNRVVIGHAAAEPSYLIDVMLEKKEQYHGVDLMHMLPMGKCAYCDKENAAYFHHTALFTGAPTRDAVLRGDADYMPCFFYESPALLRSGNLPVDVALVQVSPPDNAGYVSLGTSVDYTLAATQTAKIVIAQVNRNMPYTYGDSRIPISSLTVLVEHDAPLPELKAPRIGPIEEAIGANCALLVEDGDTLQLGIGAIPDAVLLSLRGKKDLGIHSEMFSDAVVEMTEAGVITNRRKTLHPGKSIATFLIGTRRLYNYINHNPDVEMYPVDYVNNPCTIMQLDHFVSINSCIQVDLMGQIAAESVGLKQISGVGGQVDFIRGASMARHGRSIIALSSTAGGGKISKIVAFLEQGAAVTTSRNDVDYIVTEYGVARLKGRTLRDRARALIAIAHPDFRGELKEEFARRFSACY